MEELKTQKELWDLLSDNGRLTSKIFLKAFGKILLFMLCALVVGLGFFLMANAVYLFILRFFLYWQPAYSIYVKVIDLKHAPPKLPKIPIPWYQYPILLFYFGLCLGLFYIGFDIVVSGGFLDQNMIYWFIE